ncbi:hypothetical protein ACPA9J_10175 [Pseudomonas aeruginosa]
MSAIKLGLSALNGPVFSFRREDSQRLTRPTTVEEALSEAIALTLSVSSILGALTTSDEEHACL